MKILSILSVLRLRDTWWKIRHSLNRSLRRNSLLLLLLLVLYLHLLLLQLLYIYSLLLRRQLLQISSLLLRSYGSWRRALSCTSLSAIAIGHARSSLCRVRIRIVAFLSHLLRHLTRCIIPLRSLHSCMLLLLCILHLLRMWMSRMHLRWPRHLRML